MRLSVDVDLQPKLFAVLREGYSRDQFVRDLSAGVLVGIVALPLAIAFAIASGVRPEQGIYTAIIGGFLISALSGSRVQIGGPTGAFVVLVSTIVARHGYEGLVVATVMAGILLVVMGLLRLGALIQFIPYPVTVGFTAGIALIIATTQIPELFGFHLTGEPLDFLHKWVAYEHELASTNPWSLGIGLGTILIVALWPRITTRVPGSLVALVLATAATRIFQLPVDTIGSRFGQVAAGLPSLHIPHVDLDLLRTLSSPALAIALLAGIESLLSAVVADGMTGRRHRSNAELVAQGVANIVTPLFGGIPATGAIARTATNIRSGGQSPIAGILHAVTLLVILLVGGTWASMIPMACLAGILLLVAYNMSEWRLFAKIARSTRSDTLILLVTFGLTVLIDLAVAIQVGVVLAALLFMKRMSDVTTVRDLRLVLDEEEADDPQEPERADLPDWMEVYEISGSFFFGATQKFKSTMSVIERPPRVLVLKMQRVLTIDATGLRALEEVLAQCRRGQTTLMLVGTNPQTLGLIERSGLADLIGRQNMTATFAQALDHARRLVEPDSAVGEEDSSGSQLERLDHPQ